MEQATQTFCSTNNLYHTRHTNYMIKESVLSSKRRKKTEHQATIIVQVVQRLLFPLPKTVIMH